MNWYKVADNSNFDSQIFFYDIKRNLKLKMEAFPNLSYHIKGSSNDALYFTVSRYEVSLRLSGDLYTLIVSNNEKTLISEKENVLIASPERIVSRIVEAIDNDF